MRIFIMTDMEGVAGISDFENWCTPKSRYYEDGKLLLTNEVNAAIEGFFSAGATEIVVADGHGYGGINILALDRRARYQRGFIGYPVGMEDDFQALAYIGQHPKAGTSHGHICHTGDFNVIDYSVNGVSIGEFGQGVLCAQELGVVPIFGAGDEAFCAEAKALVPGIGTVAVKRGLTPGEGREADYDAYARRNLAAVHIQPQEARRLIREGAESALRRFLSDPASFHPTELRAPYHARVEYRKKGDVPAHVDEWSHADSLIGLFNMPYQKA